MSAITERKQIEPLAVHGAVFAPPSASLVPHLFEVHCKMESTNTNQFSCEESRLDKNNRILQHNNSDEQKVTYGADSMPDKESPESFFSSLDPCKIHNNPLTPVEEGKSETRIMLETA